MGDREGSAGLLAAPALRPGPVYLTVLAHRLVRPRLRARRRRPRELSPRRFGHAVLPRHRGLPHGSRPRRVSLPVRRARRRAAIRGSGDRRRPPRGALRADALLRLLLAALVPARLLRRRRRDRNARRPRDPAPHAPSQGHGRLPRPRGAGPHVRLPRLARGLDPLSARLPPAPRPHAHVGSLRTSERGRGVLVDPPLPGPDRAAGRPLRAGRLSSRRSSSPPSSSRTASRPSPRRTSTRTRSSWPRRRRTSASS